MAKARRRKGEASIFQRASDGRWVGVVSLGISSGKRIRKVVYGASEEEVEEKLLKLQAGKVAPPQTLADIDPAKVYTAEQIAVVIGCTRGDILKKCKAGKLGFECGGWRIAGAEVLSMAWVTIASGPKKTARM